MIQEKSRVGAKRGQHPLFPPFFPPRHHFSRVKREQIRKRREKKNKARPMFPVMPPVSAAVSRVTSSPSMQLCSTTVERKGGGKKKKKRNGLALRLHFSRDKTCCRRSAGENSFSQTKKAGRGKTAVARQRRGKERGVGEEDESNVSQKRPLTIMLETR